MAGPEAYEYFLNQILEGLGPVEAKPGGSGYFSTPSDSLDPRLFDGDRLKPFVREWITNTLYAYWSHHFHNPKTWSTAWLAGSGISYQWQADRSNGDLDVLIGVDFPKFYAANPTYAGISEPEMADIFNTALRNDVWTHTAHTDFGLESGGAPSGAFEVTFYVNPNSTDIRDIKPYAAYNLRTDSWTVRPPVLPENPETLYPKEWWQHVYAERRFAQNLITHYNTLSASLNTQPLGGPGWTNALHEMGLVVDQARALFDDIHLGRKDAFGPEGRGYGDFANFRWQAHKRFGTVQALNEIARAKKSAKDAYETQNYGAPLANAEQALTTAALWNRR